MYFVTGFKTMIMAHKKEKNRDRDVNDETNMQAHRDPAQSKDYGGEAQNVADDAGRPLQSDELDHARNKAMEGIRQNRDRSQSGTNDKQTR